MSKGMGWGPKKDLSPLHLLIVIALSIFVAEALIMLLLTYLPPLSPYSIASIDSALLLLVLSPALYLLVFRPLVTHISERQRAEESFAQLEKNYRRVMDIAPVCFWSNDPQATEMYLVSPGVKSLTGYEPEDFINNPSLWFDLIHEEDREVVIEANERARREKITTSFECRFKHKDGDLRWMYDVVIPECDARGELKSVHGFAIDLTERKLTEEELSSTNKLLGSIRESQAVFIAEGDPQPAFKRLLEAFVQLTDSEYGFIDEVLIDERGQLYKKSLALSDISWDEASRKLYKKLVESHMEFRNLETLAGAPVTSGKVVISNDPLKDKRRGGLPEGHPPIKAFMGIPLYFSGELVGVAGVANRPGGYREEIADFLEPFAATCASVIHALRSSEKRVEAEGRLRVSHDFLRIANLHTRLDPLLEEFVSELKRITNCSAVGIRLLDDDGNIPYEAYSGFTEVFYELESPLSTGCDKCMCINVIKGTTNPELSFYTEGGSFYINGTTRFLATVSEEEKGETRNACNEFGFESIGLIPIRLGQSILGLIHVADSREDMVPLSVVEKLEEAAVHLGGAIQRVRAEEELSSSREIYRTLVESSADCIKLLDLDGWVLACNDGAVRAFQLEEKSQLIGKKFLSLMPKRWREELKEAFEKAARGEKGHVLTSVKGPDGELQWWDDTLVPVRDEEGRVVNVLATGREITEVKRAEEQLRKLSRAVEQSPSTVMITDTEGNIEYVNPKFTELTGYTFEEAVGQNPRILKSDKNPGEMYKELWETITSGGEWRGEFCNKKKSGELYWEFASISPIRNSEGVVTHFIGVKEDMTERKRAEEALRLTQFSVDRTGDSAFWVGRDARFNYVNDSACRSLGYSHEELLSMSVHDIDPEFPEEGWNEHWKEVKERGSFSFESCHRKKDGKVFPVEITVNYLEFEGNEYNCAFARDITERKRAEESLLEYQDRLRAIHKIGVLACSTLDLEKVLHNILSGTLEAVGASVGMIFLKNPEKGCFEWGASIGLPEAFVEDFREGKCIRPGEGLTGRIGETGETIYIPQDSSLDPRITRPVIRAEGLNSFIGVPIYADEEIIAVMNVLTRPPDVLEEEVIDLVAAVGTHVGSTIRNARLFKERVLAESDLRSLKEFNENVVSSIQDGLVVHDMEFRITFWNKAMEVITGYKAEEVLGKVTFEVFPQMEEEGVIKELRSALEGKMVERTNIAFQTPKGRTGYANAKHFPLQDHQGKIVGVMGIIEDVTETLELERKLALLQDQLEQRKIVEVAKGILMREFKISEEQAYGRIQKRSRDERERMRDVALKVIRAFGTSDELKKFT